MLSKKGIELRLPILEGKVLPSSRKEEIAVRMGVTKLSSKQDERTEIHF